MTRSCASLAVSSDALYRVAYGNYKSNLWWRISNCFSCLLHAIEVSLFSSTSIITLSNSKWWINKILNFKFGQYAEGIGNNVKCLPPLRKIVDPELTVRADGTKPLVETQFDPRRSVHGWSQHALYNGSNITAWRHRLFENTLARKMMSWVARALRWWGQVYFERTSLYVNNYTSSRWKY